ncbi:sugar-binding protein, partial [Marinifilum breve]
MHTVQYFDGLGRPDQSIQVGASPNGFDMVQPIDFDEFGREKKKYLPYTLNKANGGEHIPKDKELLQANWAIYGSEQNYAYSETQFDGSPLNRVEAQGAPGSAWQVNGKNKVQIDYATNHGTEVLLFELNGDKLEQTKHYSANQLY